MYPVRYLISLGILLFCIGYCAPVSALTFSFQPSEITLEEGYATSMALYASDFTNGLSGYNLTVILSDGSVADIESVTYPAWVSVHSESAFPGDRVWVKAVDLGSGVEAGATDVELCTLELSGENVGQSDITMVITQCDSDSGDVISPGVLDGTIIVNGDSPTPTPGPSDITFSFSPSSVPVQIGSSVAVSIVTDSLPTGLSGYNLTVTLSDGSVADIESVTYPAWVSVHSESAFPGDSVWVKAVDLGSGVEAGATDIELCTLELSGENVGQSDITMVITQCDSDSGDVISPGVLDGTIIVNGDSPTPSPGPSDITFSFSPSSVPVQMGSSVAVSIVADSLPTGLSGYNLTVILSDGSVADIESVTYPAWVSVHSESAFPGDRVWVKAVDLGSGVEAGATDVELCTLELSGENVGQSDITMVVTQCDSDSGDVLSPAVSAGEIIVDDDSPLPPAPTAKFASAPCIGAPPLKVNFTDLSLGDVTSWFWTFGDGTNTTTQHPVHIYTKDGRYTVTLTVNEGANTCTKIACIRVTSLLLGDANGDGAVNQVDTLRVLKEVVGITPTPVNGTDAFERTDVHENGFIDVGDAMFIAQYNVGLRDPWFVLV